MDSDLAQRSDVILVVWEPTRFGSQLDLDPITLGRDDRRSDRIRHRRTVRGLVLECPIGRWECQIDCVSAVAGEDELTSMFRFPDAANNVLHRLAVKVFFGLVDDQCGAASESATAQPSNPTASFGHHTAVGAGSRVKQGAEIEPYSRIGPRTTTGTPTRLHGNRSVHFAHAIENVMRLDRD